MVKSTFISILLVCIVQASSNHAKETSEQEYISGDFHQHTIRGTNLASYAPEEIDGEGNPMPDIAEENSAAKAFSDLWFYTDPVFVEYIPGKEEWYRGNTHTHARFSDENDTNDVPMIAGWYKQAGYDFLVLSEHNDHVTAKKIICHDEAADPPDFIMLCGLELSEIRHHTAVGINSYIGGETSLQDGVTRTIAAGGIPILNHPQDPVISAADFIDTKGLNHLEIVNGGRPEDTPATEKLWDSILSSPEGRMAYAVAADDNHYNVSNVARGWIMVRAPALTSAYILENIRNGNFYATTGIILDDYNVTKRSINIDAQNGDTIKFTGENGTLLRTITGNKAKYRIRGNERYVRAKIINAGGEAAWTQPVFVKRQ